MAMVLDAFVSYLQGMLTDMAADQIHLLLGVSVEIEKMGDKLKDLKNFLADADRRNITDESVQEWVTELKRAMYEASDILDLSQLKAMERGESTVDAGRCNPFLFCIRNPFHAHDIGSRIKKLNERLDTIKQRSAAFRFINLGSYEDRGRNMHDSRPGNPSRETSGELDRSSVVGEKIEEDTRALVARILEKGEGVNNSIMVFAIVGVGGIGKTTLSQNVFNNEYIQSEFEKKIWLSINQNFDRTDLLRTAITLAGGDHRGEKVLAVLQPILTEALKGKKFLLVMDDLWSHGAWEGVLKTPLVNAAASGSRVLITTRHEDVARGMTATWPHHHIDRLSLDDGWSLLKKQVVLSSETDEYQVNTLKDIGLEIIQKCGGLPLAIKVMGGLLRQREMQRHDWQEVLNDSKWSMTKMPEDLNNAVYLSYEDMPSYLKQCFLYYSLLPESRVFHADQVVAMWISEGFIHGNSDDLEGLGKKYYKELISRNLIEKDTDSYSKQLFCSMHDVVRSFAQYMSRDEALIAHNGEIDILPKLNSKKFLRLSIETDEVKPDGLDWISLQEQQSMRTLISTIPIKMKPGDSLVTCSSLRTLYIHSKDVAVVESLHQLKHLRYLYLISEGSYRAEENDGISALPGNIGKMKFLLYLDVIGCHKLVNLPDSIVKLGQLRCLNLPDEVSMIPRGFHCLKNMRILGGFPAQMDGDWCSLDELGPLSELRFLRLVQLENASSAANASLSEKKHLTNLLLYCTGRREHNEDEQQRIEKVFNELCPPSSVETLDIYGYFGQKLPSWMMSTPRVPLNNLKSLLLSRLACCTQLPDGLCHLPCLQVLEVVSAPCIKRVGTEFLHTSPATAVPFPRLQKMELKEMTKLEEWEWEEKVQAMPRLEELFVKNCKLRRVPPGLASNARALRKLSIEQVKQINCLEKFPSVVELTVIDCPDLESIYNLPKVQKLTITRCRKLKSVKDVPALQRLVLEDGRMETVPGYLGDVNPSYLELGCSLTLLTSIAAGKSGPEFAKFSHVERVKAKGISVWGVSTDLYVSYTREPYSLDTNANSSFLLGGTLSVFEDAPRLESALKMPRRAFNYVCSLAKDNSSQDMNKYTFLDGRFLSLEDRVAVALIVLNSGETPATVGSSVAVNESIISQVTESFVDAMGGPRWPDTTEMEKIKYKFDKIHGLPNCCGVVHAARIPFGSQNSDREKKNEDLLMEVIIDSDMRFTNVHLGLSDNMKQSSISHDSSLFEECEKGNRLNGSKLNLRDGRQVGEYIIGDAGCALLPWLLTPYHPENDLSDYQVEFNRRHSEAMAIVPRSALERLKDTWKFLRGEGWRPEHRFELHQAIQACCKLHNIVIEMECKAATTSNDVIYGSQEVRQVADEDAVMAREILSQHLTSKPLESGGRLAILEDAQRLESVVKMPRRTFDYVCSLLKESSLDIMSSYFFFDMKFFSLEDRVAIALIMLNSGNPPATVGSSIGVNEATVSLITRTFADVMWQRASHDVCWLDSSEIEKIKYKFDKIYGLPNCCGVVHTSHLTFGSRSCDHEENDSKIIQAVIDTDMRLAFIWMGSPDNMNQSSLLHDSQLFKECEKGTWLNGNKLNLSDGFQVGEYIVGDAGFPLLPWLLTPYQEGNLSDCQVDFNRSHSKAMAIVPRALARLKEKWKFLHGGAWHPKEQLELSRAIQACCILHNIEIDMECKAGRASDYRMNRIQEVRRLADEDVVAARDMLSQHLTRKPLESGGTLTIFEDAQRLESVLKMPRRTFDYICSLLKESSLEIMNSYFFFDMRFFSLEERVAIALIMLNSGDPPATVGSFLGVNESTVSLVTRSFVDSMRERAMYHVRWPQSDEREKMKSKFAKIHGLPNCCGVLHTTHGTSKSRSWGHQDKDKFILHGVIDPDMRFTSILVVLGPGNMNQTSFLHETKLFENCEKGAWLNGSKLKLSSKDVGEYVIGDVGYPLLPWLLTPYELQNDLPDIPSYQAEFNRRHSAARNIAVKALARLQDTWKFMHGEWRLNTLDDMGRAISVCCRLHNIVIGMEEGARMPSEQEVNYSDDQVRQLADEDAVRIRDILSQHLFISSQSEEEQQEIVASSGSGYRAKCEAREEKRC